MTNGAKGYNGVSRHVVYVGGRSKDGKTHKDTRTAAQRTALERYVADFRRRFPGVRVVGHHDLNAGKACPCFDVGEAFKGKKVKK